MGIGEEEEERGWIAAKAAGPSLDAWFLTCSAS